MRLPCTHCPRAHAHATLVPLCTCMRMRMWHACHAHTPRTPQVDRLLAEHEVLRQSLIDSKLKHMSAEQELALLHKEQARRRGT